MAAPKLPHWQEAILSGIGAPVTSPNLDFLNAWTRAEGGAAANNPFNTTQPFSGASSYNSVGVRNYPTPRAGITATIETLKNGRYGNIIAALQRGTNARSAAQALANSPWGTGALVLKILGAQPNQPGAVTAPVSGGAPGPSRLPQAAPPAPPIDLFAEGASLFGFDPGPLLALAQQTSATPQTMAVPTMPRATSSAKPAKPFKRGKTIRFLEHIAEPFGLTVTSTTGGKHVKGSYHYRGRAVDFGGNPTAMAALAKQALTHPEDFREMFYTGPGNPGAFIKDGKVYPLSQLSRGVAVEHRNHVHLAA